MHYQKRISKLGPSYYNCNDTQSNCTRRSAKPREGCPNCEFTIQTNIFRSELDTELKNLKRGTYKGTQKWPGKYLTKLVIEIGGIAGSRKGMNPKWPTMTSFLVSIYRNEAATQKAIDDFNQTASMGTNTPFGPDENEGDFD